MTVSELLPCPTPFCSAPEPYIERVGAHLYKARCKYCQVETEAQFNEAAAVEQWNTRAMKAAEPLPQGDEVERAELEAETRQQIAYLDVWQRQQGGLNGVKETLRKTQRFLAALVRSKLTIDRDAVEQAIISEIARQTDHKWPVPVNQTVALIDAEIDLQQVADAAVTAIGSQSIEGERPHD